MPSAHLKDIAKTLGSKIGLKQAVQIASQYFHDLYPARANANVMLEEIEEGDNGKSWFVTLGYDARQALAPHMKMFQPEVQREYKTFKVDNSSGKVVSMKIRVVK